MPLWGREASYEEVPTRSVGTMGTCLFGAREMNEDYVTLPERWSKFLQSQPETGLDYHVVDLTLGDGSKIHDVAIVGSSIIAEIKDLGLVQGLPGLPFDPHDIADITVTHNKWDFRR